MINDHNKLLFRNNSGDLTEILTGYEGYLFEKNPFDFFIILARYKFASRLIDKKMRVADVGCGHGLGSIFLSQFSDSVMGFDFDEERINHNKVKYSKNNLDFHRFDLLNPTETFFGCFDAVISMDVIEHFKKNDISRVLDSYVSLLKKNGFAIIGTPNIASQQYASQRRLLTHEFEFTPDEFKLTLKSKFNNVFIFSMTDEIVSTQFDKMSWYLMAICTQ